MDERRSETARVALVGPTGVGKSALARRIYAQWADEFEGVWWADGSSEEALQADLTELAEALGLSIDGGHPVAARRACNALAAKDEPWLIVVDNVLSFSKILPLLPAGPKLRLVVTTTSRQMPEAFKVIEVARLDPDTDGASLLRREADLGWNASALSRHDDVEGPKRLARMLDGLPLALVVAGAWLRGDPAATYADLFARIEAIATDLPPADYPRPFAAAVEALIERLASAAEGSGNEAQTAADAISILCVASFLAPIEVQPSFLECCGGAAGVPAENDKIRRGMALLQAASLAEAGASGAIRLHQLAQAAVRARTEREERSETVAAAAARAVDAGFPLDPQYSTNWRASAGANAHLGALTRHCPRHVPLEPLYRAAIFHMGFGSVGLADLLICKYRDRLKTERRSDRRARFRCLVAMIDLNLRRGSFPMAEKLMRGLEFSMGGATDQERAVIAAVALDFKS